MEYEKILNIASETIKELEYLPGIKLFDLNPDKYLDKYIVTDGLECGSSITLIEFLKEYTNKLLKEV